MKTTPTILLASMLTVLAPPVHAAQPEWRSWGTPEAASNARTTEVLPPTPASQTLLNELIARQQQLQLEVRELRDLVERQGYELEQLRKANKDSYADTDRRLRALEQAASAPAAAEAPSAPSAPATPAVAAAPASVSAGQEQAAYDQAFTLLKDGKYEQANKAFESFIKAHPNSPQVPNAHYWLGEIRYVQGDPKGAMQQFEWVIKNAPTHPKASDALLKIGYLFYDQKNYAKAREILGKVKEQFPGTQAANLADQRLKRMQQEGV